MVLSVNLRHPRFTAQNINLRGDCAIIGPSGAGKSTFLQCIAGLQKYEGKLTLDGDELVTVGPKRNVSLAWQDPHLVAGITVKDNLKIVGVNDELIKMFGIEGLMDRHTHQISGGEAQRVGLVRALSANARLVLLDEPMQGLDPVLIRKLLGKIKSYCNRNGKQLIVVTHELYHAYGILDFGMLVKSAQVHAIGPMQHLYDVPASPWAANFFGPYFVLNEKDLAQFEHHRNERPCLVRPEWLKIKREKEPNATVTSVKWNGPSQKVNVQLHCTGKPLAVEVNTDQSFVTGENIYVNFKKSSRPSWV